MYRQRPARLLRCDRSKPDARRGFTLVELLVVITIIAMLVGLLIPAVMRAREAARRTQCLNNQRNIGTAVVNYVTEKNKFPPLFTLQPQPVSASAPAPVSPAPAVGWVPPLLPFLEQNPLYQAFQANNWANMTTSGAEVSTLICPSRNPTFSPAPLSYIVNAGQIDIYKTAAPPPPLNLDYRENGVFFDDYAWRDSTLPTPRPPKPPVIDMSYLTQHDGNAQTLLLSENLNALDWIRLPLTPPEFAPPQRPDYTSGNAVVAWWQSFTWFIIPQPPNDPNWGMANSSPSNEILNKQPNPPPAGPPTSLLWEIAYSRPSSNHPGGFIVTMCDASSRFMSEEISYRLYCLLAAPDSANAKLPSNGSPVVYPLHWHSGTPPLTANPLTPVTSADYE